MNLQQGGAWKRRGCSVLWDTAALAAVAVPTSPHGSRDRDGLRRNDRCADFRPPCQSATVCAGAESVATRHRLCHPNAHGPAWTTGTCRDMI